MGQEAPKSTLSSYNSRDYFQRQIDFYRWRADPSINQNICRIMFHEAQSIQDRQKLQNLLQSHFTQNTYISLNDILKLASENKNKPKEELMTFQTYVCTLADLEEKLNLEQILYTLQCLFNGFEILLCKFGKIKNSLYTCFVTKEGQVRAWFNSDFKSNEVNLQQNDKSILIKSETALIKSILQIGERLCRKHTEILHFTRQFRSYMERDILQNWNFANARKLINSYAYTYRIKIASSLIDVLKKWERTSCNSSVSNLYRLQTPQSSTSSISYTTFMPTKTDLQSTGDHIKKNSFSSIKNSKKQIQQRPASYSDFSSNKSKEFLRHPLKSSHSKKLSSTDLRQYENQRKYQSLKVSKSNVISQYSNKSESNKRKEMTFFEGSSNGTSHKIKKQKQLLKDDKNSQSKLNSTEICSPYHEKHMSFEEASLKFNQKIKVKQNFSVTGILKQNQCSKQKKKLEKKAAAVQKYISFCKQTKNSSPNDISAPSLSSCVSNELSEQKQCLISESAKSCTISKSGKSCAISESEKLSQNSEMIQYKYISSSTPTTPKVTFSKKQNSVEPPNFNYTPTALRKVSFQNSPSNAPFILPFKGRSQFFKKFQQQNSNQSDHYSSNFPDNFTIKTVNKLIGNSEVSEIQSLGTLQSIQEKEGSEYQGVLNKMGRSVDIKNIPPSKNLMLHKKPITTSNNFTTPHHY